MPNDIMQILDPQTAADQIALQRRMAFADALRQQSMSGLGGTDVVGGIAIQKSPLEGIAKMFQGYAANKVNQQTDAERKAMALRQSEALNPLFGLGTTNPSTASTSALMLGALQGDVGPTNTNAARMDNILAQGNGSASTGGGMTIPGMNPNMAKLAFALDQPAYISAYLKQYETTNEMKNAAWMGQDPRLLGALDLAAKRKAGIIEYQPGTTSQDLVTGQTRFQPKVGEGIGLNPDNSSFGLPGYANANAAIQGAQAGAVTNAQERAKAPFADPIVLQGAGAEGSNLIIPRVNAPALNGAIPTQSPIQKKVDEAKADAAINSAKTQQAIQPLLTVIQQAKQLAPKVPYGGYGLAETKAGVSSLPFMSHEASQNAALWEQMMGQNILNTIQQLVASGGIRMDIPIVKEIQKAGGIPLGLPPEAKLRMLNQLENEITNKAAATGNVVPALNQPGIANINVPIPMQSQTSLNGNVITHPQYPGFSIAR